MRTRDISKRRHAELVRQCMTIARHVDTLAKVEEWALALMHNCERFHKLANDRAMEIAVDASMAVGRRFPEILP